MAKTFLFTLLLLPFFSFAQDWPSNYKDLNDTCDVIPLGVDFGLCQMALGWALTDSGCVVLSGCSWLGSDGINYQSSFFSSSYECNSACLQDTIVLLSCMDSSLIDLSVFCPSVIDPVCGCDSITYQNSCQAMYYYGVSSYYPGACVTSKLQTQLGSSIGVFPNPSNGVFHLAGLPIHAQIVCTDLLENAVFQMSADQKTLDIALGFLPKGCYLLTVNGILVEKLLIE